VCRGLFRESRRRPRVVERLPHSAPHIGPAIRDLSTIGGNRRSRSAPVRSRHVRFEQLVGTINSDLTVGANVAAAKPLKSNRRLASPGMKLHGDGFIVTPLEAYGLSQSAATANELIRDYRNGRDLMGHSRGVKVLDLYGLSESELRERFPAIYQHVEMRVRPHRKHNNRPAYRENWWIFGEPRRDLRAALRGLKRYIATVETSKHRVFQFLSTEVVPDNMVIAIALDDPFYLGVLSSRIHLTWSLAAGGRLGVGNDPRYNKTRCFDPFPFPSLADVKVVERIREIAESLDKLRKSVLERHPDLTLTQMYNGLDALRRAILSGSVLTPSERALVERSCVSLLNEYHMKLDDAVAQAYGWAANLADDTILQQLTILNAQRAREEANGVVRWLRKGFQAPTYAETEERELALGEPAQAKAEIIQWPGALPEQVVAVASIVDRARQPVAPTEVARRFRGKRAASVVPVLDALAGMGRLRKLNDGRYAA